MAHASVLLAQSMASEDAEVGGLHADDVLSDTSNVTSMLAGARAWPSARFAVVQRYGRVGALMVIAHEQRWRRSQGEELTSPCAQLLDTLVEGFWRADADQLYELLSAIDRSEGDDRDDEAANAHRRLHATYAVAARDGTYDAHRAYMQSLDRVMRSAASVLAS